jgi:hypothetical protein
MLPILPLKKEVANASALMMNDPWQQTTSFPDVCHRK